MVEDSSISEEVIKKIKEITETRHKIVAF